MKDRRAPAPMSVIRSPVAWLTIEDSLLRARVSSLLRRTGYAIVDLNDPAELLEYLADALSPSGQVRRPTMVVIDLDPIDAEPVALLSRLRSADPGLPIIALIDDTDIEVFERASQLEVNVLFVKPFELDLMRTAAATFATRP